MQQHTSATNSYALDRWLQQSMHDDPYHNLYAVTALPPAPSAAYGYITSDAQSRADATQGSSGAAAERNKP